MRDNTQETVQFEGGEGAFQFYVPFHIFSQCVNISISSKEAFIMQESHYQLNLNSKSQFSWLNKQ